MVHHGEPLGALQPGRRLPVGDDVDVTVVWKEALQRAQAVAQLVVVAKAAFDIAKGRNRHAAGVAEILQSLSPLGPPARVLTVYPEVNNVDGGVRRCLHQSGGSGRRLSA